MILFVRRLARLARHAFTALAALSLLLCVAVCVLWARSYGSGSVVRFHFRGVHWWARSDHGELSVDNEPQRAEERIEAGRHRVEFLQTEVFPYYRRTQYERERIRELPQGRERADAMNRLLAQDREISAKRNVPFVPRPPVRHAWLHAHAFAATVMLPVLWAAVYGRSRVRSWRRVRMALVGLCPRCGYDLRASPERCPECGATNPAAV